LSSLNCIVSTCDLDSGLPSCPGPQHLGLVVCLRLAVAVQRVGQGTGEERLTLPRHLPHELTLLATDNELRVTKNVADNESKANVDGVSINSNRARTNMNSHGTTVQSLVRHRRIKPRHVCLAFIMTGDFYTKDVWNLWREHAIRDNIGVTILAHMSRPTDDAQNWMSLPTYNWIEWIPEQQTSWGGPGTVAATMSLITEAFARPENLSSHVILLSQDCIPLLKAGCLSNYLATVQDKTIVSLMGGDFTEDSLLSQSIVTTPYLFVNKDHWTNTVSQKDIETQFRIYSSYHTPAAVNEAAQFGMDEIFLATMIQKYNDNALKRNQRIVWTLWDNVKCPCRGMYASSDFTEHKLPLLLRGHYQTYGLWFFARKFRDSPTLHSVIANHLEHGGSRCV
jgi:hypothetical protein